jgi:hypothetical protein
LTVDQTINQAFAPIARAFSDVIFFSVSVGGTDLQLIVLWLVAGGAFFTVYLRFINLRGFAHALRLVRGDYADPEDPGEVSHFQALATAISGTVGVGNIAHVAIAISVGGPGAAFWMWVAGLLGMSSKFVECTLGVKYRWVNRDGSVSGGPMFYLDRGLAERGWPRLGRVMAVYYAICIMIGCFGIGSMFQSNQAYVQFLNVTGGSESLFAGRGWLFGLLLALCVGAVIVGGIRRIAHVAEAVVPFMALVYVSAGLFVIGANAERVPHALSLIVTGAFSPDGVAGGMLGVLILGFRRAAFSHSHRLLDHGAGDHGDGLRPGRAAGGHERRRAHLTGVRERHTLVSDTAGRRGDALRLLDHDRLVLLRSRGLRVPVRVCALGEARLQPAVLRDGGARLHHDARCRAGLLGRDDLRDGTGEPARVVPAGAGRARRARIVPGATQSAWVESGISVVYLICSIAKLELTSWRSTTRIRRL